MTGCDLFGRRKQGSGNVIGEKTVLLCGDEASNALEYFVNQARMMGMRVAYEDSFSRHDDIDNLKTGRLHGGSCFDQVNDAIGESKAAGRFYRARNEPVQSKDEGKSETLRRG